MPADIVYVAQRDPLQYRPGIPRSVRSLKDDGEGSHTREIELKRSRGEISCAECRRLKIKCDKQLPCSSCLRRGCASLCPNGSLSTGQGTRYVLAATDHLHRRISKMSERIRQLEDALAILQTHVSDEPHPLLRDELLSVKVDKSDDVVEAEGEQDVPKGIDGLGTLSISDKGSLRFFGASGGSEVLFLNDDDDDYYSSPSASTPSATSNIGSSPASMPASARDSKSPRISPEVALFSNAFPFTPIGPALEVQAKIETFFPPWEAALALAEIYLEHAAWIFRSVSRAQLMDELLPIVYRRAPPTPGTTASYANYEGPHALALLLMIFALGTLVDLSQEPYSAEADHYYQLAKAAITLQSMLDRPELATIQCLHLMSIYNAMRQPDIRDEDGDTSMEMSWTLIRLSHQLAQTIGLHRDSVRWGLDALEVQRRRSIFWDLFVADSWQSLATGRPPSITLPYIDCQFPLDDEAHLNAKGKAEPGFGSWVFRFACECVGVVAAKTLTASVPPYTTILELDAKIRNFPIPEFPDVPLDKSKPAMMMSRFVASHMRETILLNLHRSFFAQAMIDDPVNPLRSHYAPSFLATYRSASHILKSICEQFEILPDLSARFWAPWTFAFSSAVVFGTIVTRGPSSSMAPASLQELDSAVDLFARAGKHSRRAAKALTILQKLHTKAHAAYDSCLRTKATLVPPGSEAQLLHTPKQEKDDELDIFSGRVRVVSSRRVGPSTGGSPPDLQGGGAVPSSNQSPPPLQSQIRSAHLATFASGSEISMAESSSLILPRTNAVAGVPLSATCSSVKRESLFYPHGVGVDTDTAPDFRGLYPERRQGGTYMTSSNEYPPAVKYDEWAPPPPTSAEVRATHAHGPHQHTIPRYEHSNSHSSHPVSGVDGMEYGHGSAGPAAHHGFVPQQHHLHPPSSHTQAFGAPAPAMAGANAYYLPGHTHSSPGMGAYAPAPRELAEMGLASQHSGLNQRWTSFMHDSGLFYGAGAAM